MKSFTHLASFCGAIGISVALLRRRVSSEVRVGAQIYDHTGQFWGAVVETSDAHLFPGGRVEPGILVDVGPYLGRLHWLPVSIASMFKLRY